MVLFFLALIAAIVAAIGLALIGIVVVTFLVALVTGPVRARVHHHPPHGPSHHRHRWVLHH